MTPTTTRLQAGDLAPDFELPDADGRIVRLPAYRGQRVVLYAFPAAGTPGCTSQACDFRDSLDALAAAGVAVLGLSPDDPTTLAGFRDQHGLSFPLLADPGRVVLQAYGAFGEKISYGRPSVGVIRSTFVIDEAGVIESAQYAVKATGHVARLRRTLGI